MSVIKVTVPDKHESGHTMRKLTRSNTIAEMVPARAPAAAESADERARAETEARRRAEIETRRLREAKAWREARSCQPYAGSAFDFLGSHRHPHPTELYALYTGGAASRLSQTASATKVATSRSRPLSAGSAGLSRTKPPTTPAEALLSTPYSPPAALAPRLSHMPVRNVVPHPPSELGQFFQGWQPARGYLSLVKPRAPSSPQMSSPLTKAPEPALSPALSPSQAACEDDMTLNEAVEGLQNAVRLHVPTLDKAMKRLRRAVMVEAMRAGDDDSPIYDPRRASPYPPAISRQARGTPVNPKEAFRPPAFRAALPDEL